MNGPAYDMPTMITKYRMLGMPLFDCIKAATATPAKMLGADWAATIGHLGVGACADICLLKTTECDCHLEDSIGQLRHCNERFVCVGVWKDGKPHRVTSEAIWPNPESAAWGAQRWNSVLQPKDAAPPPPSSPEVRSHRAIGQR
eukprot:SAG31_NODE_11084_length_1068_cov_0.848297_3_plen_144_part_00